MNKELQTKLIEKIAEERAIQEKKMVTVVIFYFLILLSVQFCIQRFFPIVYTGIIFRTSFLSVLVVTLVLYFFFKKKVLVENNGFKKVIKDVFAEAGIEYFEVKKNELINALEAELASKDRNIEILYKNLKSY
ncbi:MAG: hypothetical protein II220_01120 [Spirochaetales bacterium]|nr:hypothetical protein [Spirochaetales bacterium]